MELIDFSHRDELLFIFHLFCVCAKRFFILFHEKWLNQCRKTTDNTSIALMLEESKIRSRDSDLANSRRVAGSLGGKSIHLVLDVQSKPLLSFWWIFALESNSQSLMWREKQKGWINMHRNEFRWFWLIYKVTSFIHQTRDCLWHGICGMEIIFIRFHWCVVASYELSIRIFRNNFQFVWNLLLKKVCERRLWNRLNCKFPFILRL